MLEYVHTGDSVRASTVNDIIDAVDGRASSSPDLLVTGSPGGAQVAVPSEMGFSDFKPPRLFDVEEYVFSGWPMAKIQLGFSLSCALVGMAAHEGDLTESPVSSFAIWDNPSNSPAPGLSGEKLAESMFGNDGRIGCAGWINTKIDCSRGEIKAQLWKAGTDFWQTFTNADDESVESELRRLAPGADGLSALEKKCGWTLWRRSELNGEGWTRATNAQLVGDTLETWEGAKQGYSAYKAELVCIKAPEGNDDGTTEWTWAIPLPPDAEWNAELTGVASDQLTFGGDQVCLECKRGEVGQGYSGQATMTSAFYGIGSAVCWGKYSCGVG